MSNDSSICFIIHKAKKLPSNQIGVSGNKLFLTAAIGNLLSILLILYFTNIYNNNPQSALGLIQSEMTPISSIREVSGNITAGLTTTTANQNNTFLTFDKPSLGISIQYPSEWLVSQHSLNSMFVTQFLSPIQSTPDELPVTVTVLVQTLPVNVTSLDQYTNLIYKILELVFRGGVNVTELNNSTAIAGSIPAYERLFSARQLSLGKNLDVVPHDLRIIKLYGIDDNKIYDITYAAEASEFSSYLPIVQRMFDSFRIEPATNTASNKTAEFNSAFSTYIQPGSGKGYGIYSERPSNTPFKSGETAEIYVQLSGFGYKPEILSNKIGDTIYTKNLTANILIFDKQGKQLMATKYQVPKTTIPNNKVDQQYITVPTQIPQNIPSGDYEVRYFIIDNISGKNFEINKNIRIALQIQAFVD